MGCPALSASTMPHWSQRTSHLYDSVNRWLEKYGQDAYERLKPERDGPSGEERFTELVLQHITPSDTVLDIGTGDASWLMREVAPHVRRAIGLDYGARRLWDGAQSRTATPDANTELFLADARHIPLRDGSADALINRRGPWTAGDDYMREGLRILKPKGLALEITIGEQNARELDGLFGERNQMHHALASGRPRLDSVPDVYRAHGLEVLLAESYISTEVFASRDALFFRLETTPTVDGFDPVADVPGVDAFIEGHGLSLTVHRLCFVSTKAA
jgi:ubiquinone/menaquinone biosynthesis C-methylase UbiE